MKLSVILGVGQMVLGITLKGLNSLYFKSKMDFFFEFIPQFIFMNLLFGYMCVMIFIKWSTDWSDNLSNSPSIITTLMNLFLKMGSVDNKPLYNISNPLFQENLQFYFLIISLICLPVILIPKPILTYWQVNKDRKKIYSSNKINFQKEQKEDKNKNDISDKQNPENHQNYEYQKLPNFEEEEEEQPGINKKTNQKNLNSNLNEEEENDPNHQEDHGFGDIFVHQAIETIEFTLGSISNTASYLRLWALSLAHAQLAKVFFEKSLLGFIQEGNLILVIIGFFIFINVTFFVLMCMDLMECFLHTLRLHWVEFQNKFYKADGRKFNPYDFSTLLIAN